MNTRLLLSMIILILIIQVSLFSLDQDEQIPKKYLEEYFNWTFLTRDSEGNIKALNYEEIFNLDDSREYRIKILLKKTVYIYIYLYDSNDDLTLVFPHRFGHHYELGKEYIIPESENWLSLKSDIRIKNFYIIASDTPIKKLEELTISYLNSLADNNPDLNPINRTKAAILNMLNELELKDNYFTKSAEKPLPIAGDVKTENDENDLLWSE